MALVGARMRVRGAPLAHFAWRASVTLLGRENPVLRRRWLAADDEKVERE